MTEIRDAHEHDNSPEVEFQIAKDAALEALLGGAGTETNPNVSFETWLAALIMCRLEGNADKAVTMMGFDPDDKSFLLESLDELVDGFLAFDNEN